MKTSKIKEIKSISEPDQFGNLWHNLTMENGDKLNIGKRKKQEIGWDLTYEVTGDDQQEYVKASTPKRDSYPSKTVTNNQDGVQDAILYQVCLKGVFDFYTTNFDNNIKDHENLFTSDSINELTLSIAKGAKENIKALKQSN